MEKICVELCARLSLSRPEKSLSTGAKSPPRQKPQALVHAGHRHQWMMDFSQPQCEQGPATIFGDPIIATAILDRLLHYSTKVSIRGDSYRLKERKKASLLSAIQTPQEDHKTIRTLDRENHPRDARGAVSSGSGGIQLPLLGDERGRQ